MTATKDGRKLEFHLCRKAKDTQGYLPETVIEKKKYSEGYYPFKCVDDNIMVNFGSKPVPLDIWFSNINDSWWKENYTKII
jgi:hypothetical protein